MPCSKTFIDELQQSYITKVLQAQYYWLVIKEHKTQIHRGQINHTNKITGNCIPFTFLINFTGMHTFQG